LNLSSIGIVKTTINPPTAPINIASIGDVVGAIPVHLFAGIWGTIAVIFSNSDATIGAQLYGIFAIGAFTIIASGIAWYIIKVTIGVRVTPEEEMEGMDMSEIGMEAYPDFRK
jgi:Amt family ammonium transporter